MQSSENHLNDVAVTLPQLLTREFGPDILDPVEPEHTLHGVTPLAVAAPRNEEQALQLVKWCGANHIALVPRGGGTAWRTGARPTQMDLVLSTRHLDTVIDHDVDNATVEAGAGITVARLNRHLGERNQFLPFDALGNSTLGGLVARNERGSWSGKYGTPRDMVTGLAAVLSDGRHIVAGAKVVKNVSGYDLPRLFTGSHGSLGLITRVTVRVRPMDEESAVWSHTYASLEDAAAAAKEIADGPFAPTSLEIFWASGPAGSSDNAWQVRCRVDGGAKSVRHQLQSLELKGQSGPRDSLIDNSLTAWRLKVQLPNDKPTRWIMGAIASGVCWLRWDCVLGQVRAALPDTAPVSIVHDLRRHAEDEGGFLVAEAVTTGNWETDTVWGKPGNDFSLQSQVKRLYDVHGVFSPGRFVGGL